MSLLIVVAIMLAVVAVCFKKQLKEGLLNKFFKSEMEKHEYNVRERNRIEKENEIKKIRLECKRKEALWNCVKEALDEGDEIVSYEVNKKNETVIIARSHVGVNLNYLLYGESYQTCGNHPGIKGVIENGNDPENKCVYIADVEVVDENIGNGSLLMEKYIDFCKKIGVSYIYGKLVDTDKDHFDRSEAFYKKHGFKVTFNKDRSGGNIRLNL